MSRYRAMFDRLAKARAGAFVPFCVLGDPHPDQSAAILDALVAGGADALELGIPFSDPIADGPIIQAADVRALAAGTRAADAWRILADFRAHHPHVPMGLLVYANLVEARGAHDFYARAAAAGVDSVLVADVPTIEAEPYCQAAKRAGVAPVLIATPHITDAHAARIAALSLGYTYVVSRRGVTGVDREVGVDLGATVERLRRANAPPALVGFGISLPKHVSRALATGAAGAISGSAVVSIIERHLDDAARRAEALAAFVARMKGATLRGN